MKINIGKTHVFEVPCSGFQEMHMLIFLRALTIETLSVIGGKCFLGKWENKELFCSVCSQGILLSEREEEKKEGYRPLQY